MSARRFLVDVLTEVRVEVATRLAPLTVSMPMAEALEGLGKVEPSEQRRVERVRQATLLAACDVDTATLHAVCHLAARGELGPLLGRSSRREETRVYRCPACKGWHLTSQTRKTRPKETS